MAKGEEKQRRKQAALKERLMREQALRRARELATGKKDRPLAGLAATEARLKAQRVAPAASAGSSRLSKVGSALKVGGGFLAGRLWGATKGAASATADAARREVEPNKLAGWIFFILSLILYYFVDWGTGYNGIDFGFFTNLGGADWLLKSGFLTIAAIIAVAQFIFAKPKSVEEFRSNLSLSLVLAFVFLVSKYSVGALFHSIFLLGIWFFLLRPVKDTISSNKTLIALILIDFIGFSALKYLLTATGFLGGAVIVANYLVFPIFALYILGYLKAYGKSGLAAWLLFFIIVLYIFGFISNSVQYQTLTAEIDEKQREEAWSFWKTSLIRFREFGGTMFDPLACSAFTGSSPTNYDECLRERQFDRFCAEYGRKTEEYNNCMRQKQGLDISGTTDKTIKEITKIELKKQTAFTNQIQKEFAPAIPMQINIESPEKPVTIKFSCKFKTGGEEFEGEVQPEQIDEIIGTKQQTILCQKPSDKEYQEGNRYTTTFKAEIQGMETESTLTRLFTGKELDEKEKTSLLTLHDLKQAEPSKNPEEFAALSFGIGTPPTNPFINENPTQPLVANIQNLANGKIISIEDIEITLIDEVRPDTNCLTAFDQQGERLILKSNVAKVFKTLKLKRGEKLFVLGCNLNIDPRLAQTTDYVTRGFSSKLKYTYEIEAQESFNVIRSIITT